MPAHMVFEGLAYAAAFLILRCARARRGDFLSETQRYALVAAAMVGAALGSTLLHHLAQPSELAARLADPRTLLGGKSIVGALLGGWCAVELAKGRLGIERRTGDLYALPLVVGIAIGRVGCFLAGPADGTCGSPATLLPGIDLGDGVPRYPVLLGEIGFLAALGWALTRPAWFRAEGQRFRAFVVAYLAFRLAIDFLKPFERVAGLGVIQWACLSGLLAILWLRRPAVPAAPAVREGVAE